MDHPAYTWWPWRAMAAGLPLAAGGVALVASDPVWIETGLVLQSEEHMRLFFCIYAGGTAVLLGLAIGDLARSLLALVAGTTAGVLISMGPDGFGLLYPPCSLFVVGLALSPRTSRSDVFVSALTCFHGGLIFAILAALVLWICEPVFPLGEVNLLRAALVLLGLAVANVLAMGAVFQNLMRVSEQDRGGVV